MFVLIDTSVWTRALRRNGDPATKARVAALIQAGTAAWCDAVRLELWAGVRNDTEREQLKILAANVHRLPINDAAWDKACSLGGLARGKGLAFPACDLVIFACALIHGAEIESFDQHYDVLKPLVSD